MIRDEALRRSARAGPEAVTLHQIAGRSRSLARAGGTPLRLVRHFGSEKGLRMAVDEQATRVFDDLFENTAGNGGEQMLAAGAGTLFSEAVV